MAVHGRTWDAVYWHGAGRLAPAPPDRPHAQTADALVAPAPPEYLQVQPAAGAHAGTAVSRTRARPIRKPLIGRERPEERRGLAAELDSSMAAELRRGLKVVILVLGLAGGWAGLVPLSGAVVTAGTVVSASDVKKIQHPSGGIVRQILVHDGMEVEAGALLVKLDTTNARAGLEIAASHLLETRAKLQRLAAERDALAAPTLTLAAIEGISTDHSRTALAAEATLLEARAKSRQQQLAVMRNHIAELRQGVEGMQAQIAAKSDERALVQVELTGITALYRDKLVTLNRLTSLRRDASRLSSESSALAVSMAEARSKIAETELQISRESLDFHTQVLGELRDAEAKAGEFAEQYTMALEQLRLTDIRAPQAGIVHDLTLHTLGGVVGPAEILMLIAPDNDDLQIEAPLQPRDIDQVTAGQPALLRLAAFDRNTTPELAGAVAYVSPDATRDPRTNAPAYKIRISIAAGQLSRLGNLHLMTGMPAEVFLTTGSRTALSYLFKPLTDQLYRMFRGR